jgi:homoserine dehydrogenase
VGAGTPVLATARTLAAGDTILKIRGIMNGTTNFILWRMATQPPPHDTYESALKEAMRLGYAETDPSADVDGIDTATKVVILANAVLRMGATATDVKITGIRDFPKKLIDEAATRDQTMKLIGEIDAVTRSLTVSPQSVPRHGPMDVPANLNAVQFTLKSAGEVTLVGRGAGGAETATAILRDLADIWHATGAVS